MIIKGTVVKGRQMGRQIGFPTANILPKENLTLKHGVFISCIKISGQGKIYKAATSVGPAYVFGETKETVESYILDFSEDIYGEEVELELVQKIRDMQNFDSVDELIEQIKEDVERVKEYSV